MNDPGAESRPKSEFDIYARRLAIAACVAAAILFFFKDSLWGYFGVAIVLIALLDFWKLGRFHIGRLLAVLIVLTGATCDYAAKQAEMETPDVRVSRQVADVGLNIDGVSPLMTRDDVESRLGTGREDGDGIVYRNEVYVSFLDSGEVWLVRGPRLFDGERLFLEKGQSLRKLLTVLPHSELYGRVTEVRYEAFSPDLAVEVENDVITGFTLESERGPSSPNP